jgi:hypothetical protein
MGCRDRTNRQTRSVDVACWLSPSSQSTLFYAADLALLCGVWCCLRQRLMLLSATERATVSVNNGRNVLQLICSAHELFLYKLWVLCTAGCTVFSRRPVEPRQYKQQNNKREAACLQLLFVGMSLVLLPLSIVCENRQ